MVLVLMVALIVIGVATKDHKLIMAALVVGAVPAVAGTTSGLRSGQQDERTRPIKASTAGRSCPMIKPSRADRIGPRRQSG